MTTDEKLAAILAAVQVDPGNRGLKNLFAHCPADFAAACRCLVPLPKHALVITGFFIPSADPPAYETDGPLGALFLERALAVGSYDGTAAIAEGPIHAALDAARARIGIQRPIVAAQGMAAIYIERGGPALDGKRYTMRGRDITDHLDPQLDIGHSWGRATIGIGDGGNEIGMGKIPHDIVARDIANGDLIHCRVPVDHLIVAGVSNWGAYALAAGVYVLRGIQPPTDLFDPDREREILEVMVKEGPLVDGVTGRQTATVDGLTWEVYIQPLIRIREIVET
jgi:D-glutamate cyclase